MFGPLTNNVDFVPARSQPLVNYDHFGIYVYTLRLAQRGNMFGPQGHMS